MLGLSIAWVGLLSILRGCIVSCTEALLEILHEFRVIFARLSIRTFWIVHYSSQQIQEELLEFVASLLSSFSIS